MPMPHREQETDAASSSTLGANESFEIDPASGDPNSGALPPPTELPPGLPLPESGSALPPDMTAVQAELVPTALPLPYLMGDQVQRLESIVLEQQRQIQEQQIRTQMLTDMLEQQQIINEEQVQMNQQLLSTSRRIFLDDEDVFSTESVSSGVASAAAIPRIVDSDAQGEAGGGGTIQDSSRDSTWTDTEGDRGNEARKMAALPPCASSILFGIQRHKLLPREEEVQKVIDALLDTTNSYSAAQPNPRRSNVVQRIDDDSFSEVSTVEHSGVSAPSMEDSSHSRSGVASRGSRGEYFDPASFATTIVGMGGTGKTTLAAMSLSRGDVLYRFCDGIGWIRLGQRGRSEGATPGAPPPSGNASTRLTHQAYAAHLRSLCRQLGISPPEFGEVVSLPGDDDCVLEGKTLRAMEDARQAMTSALDGKSVLVVLDDLWHRSDVAWFAFGTRPTSSFRLLVTTRLQFQLTGGAAEGGGRQLPGGHIINLCSLKEEEAVRMLMTEARGLFATQGEENIWTAEEERDAVSIVRSCWCVPVAVRSAGRLLASAATNDNLDSDGMSLEDLASHMSRWQNHEQFSLDLYSEFALPHDVALFEILGRSFAPELHGDIPARAMKICFTTFALVFARADCARPFVPITTIHMLFEGILLKQERLSLQDDPRMSFTLQLMEKLERMGLVDSALKSIKWQKLSQDGSVSMRQEVIMNYRVHHDSMLQFAMFTLENDAILEYREINCRLRKNKMNFSLIFPPPSGLRSPHSLPGKRSKKAQQKTRRIEKLNLLIGLKYEGKRNERPDRPWDRAVKNDGYVFNYLPSHMINAGGESMCTRVVHLLCDDGFIRGRVTFMGVERCVKAHCRDIEAIISRLQNRKKSTKDSSSCLLSPSLKNDVLSIFGALCTFLKEQFPKEGPRLQIEGVKVAAALVDVGVLLQTHALWIQALDNFANALEICKSIGLSDDHPDVSRTRLHIQASSLPLLVLVPKTSPKCIKIKNASKLRGGTVGADKDGIPLELSSHPGLGIVVTRPHFVKAFGSTLQPLGVGLKVSAIRVCAQGQSVCRPCDGALLSSLSPVVEGNVVALTPSSMQSNPKRYRGCVISCGFKINDDGSISPESDANLALGIGDFPLCIVSRSSPNRFILKYGRELCARKVKEVGHHPAKEEGTPLELASHPGCAIKLQNKVLWNIGPAHVRFMGVGPAEDAIQASYDGRIIGSSRDGAIFKVMGKIGAVYEIGSAIWLFRANKKSMTRWKGGVNDFVINEDGSISPTHAPNVALGCACLGLANELVTEEQRLHAEEQSRLKSKQATLVHKYQALQVAMGVALKFDPAKFSVELA